MLKRIAGWGLVVLLLAGLCMFVFRTKQPKTNSFRAADGSVISLIAVAYGSNSTCVWGKPYQRALYKHLPARWKGYSGVSIFSTPIFLTNVPIFWFHESSPTNPLSPAQTPLLTVYASWPEPTLRLVDEFGCECDKNSSSGGWAGITTGFYGSAERISHYQLGAGDPHGKICGVCVYDNGEKDKRVATFLLPGAALLPLPTVKQPVAAPVKVGDMTFELTSLLTGLKSEPFAYSKMTNGVLYSEADFHITKNGAPAPNWMPVNIRAVNAKGKRVTYTSRSRGMKEREKIYNFASDLNPADGPFKLQAEFQHWSGFSSNELVTFKDVPFPAEGQSVTLKMEMETQGQRVILDAIYSVTDGNPTNAFQSDHPFIMARIAPTTNSFHLLLLAASDENGAEISLRGMSGPDKGAYQFGLDPKAKTGSITLTFALHQSRFAEFEAVPVVVSTNRLAKN